LRGLWLEDLKLRLREDLPCPEPPPGEARVDVLLAGVCNTDLELAKGYYPYAGVPGHEFVGRVARAPSAPGWEGRRVVGEINAACGSCEACRGGRPTHCEARTVLGIRSRDGCFAEALMLPLQNLHPVPDSLSDHEAVFVEPLAAALQVQEQVEVSPGMRVVVVGAGKLGQLVARTLCLTGCDLLVVGRSRASLDRLAGLPLRAGTASDLTPGRADLVVECTGDPLGFLLARRAVRPRGTLVLKSTHRGETRVNLSSVVVDEVTLVGSRCGPFPKALDALARRRVDVACLVDACYSLEAGLQAFEAAGAPGVLKVLLRP
jgi:threonine dehydrogenase-like Zn-dependent dehydrogenase